jgi:hypothetical protein
VEVHCKGTPDGEIPEEHEQTAGRAYEEIVLEEQGYEQNMFCFFLVSVLTLMCHVQPPPFQPRSSGWTFRNPEGALMLPSLPWSIMFQRSHIVHDF